MPLSLEHVLSRLDRENLPFDARSKNNIRHLLRTGKWTPDLANRTIDDALYTNDVLNKNRKPDPEQGPMEKPAYMENVASAGKFVMPTKPELDAMVQGAADPYSGLTDEQRLSLRQKVKDELETRERNKLRKALVAEKHTRAVQRTSSELATTPIGEPVPVRPYSYVASFPMPTDPIQPESNDPRALAEQARKEGVDVRGGAGLVIRTLKGIAGMEANENARESITFAVLNNQLRPQAQVDSSVPILYKEQNTGKIAYLRRITEDDVAEGRDPKEDLGKLRPTLIDAQGLDLGDLAEVLPVLSDAGMQAVASVAAGVPTATVAGPGAGVAASAAAGALYAGLSRPARYAFLKQFAGLTEKQIKESGADTDFDSFSAALSAMTDSGVAGAIAVRRFLKGRKRFLTKEQYDEVVNNIGKNKQLFDDVYSVTGVKILPEHNAPNELLTESPEVLVEAAGQYGALPKYRQRQRVAAALRAQKSTGDATKVLIDSNVPGSSRYSPDLTDIVLPTNRTAGETAAAAQSAASKAVAESVQTQDAAEAALERASDGLPDVSRRSVYNNLQSATRERLEELKTLQTKKWVRFDEMVEFNPRTAQAGIHLANDDSKSYIRSAARNLIAQSEQALSSGSATKKVRLLDDLSRLVGSDTLDMKQLHIVYSELKQLSRDMAAGAAEGIGFAKRDVDAMITAISDQVATAPLVRTKTGGRYKSREEDIRRAWHEASDATFEYRRLSNSDAVKAMTEREPVFSTSDRVATDLYSPEALDTLARETSGNSRSTTVYMTPNQFLRLAENVDSASPGSLKKQATVEGVRKSGGKFKDVPFLSGKTRPDGSIVVEAHEGRHRMMQLAKEGYGDTRIPIRLTNTEGGSKVYRWNNTNERPTKLHGQGKNSKNSIDFKDIQEPQTFPDGYRFKVLPDTVRETLFKKADASALLDMMEAVGWNPEHRQALGQELLARYKQEVMPEGKWKQIAHEKFMQEHGDHLEVLFGAKNAERITNVEAFGRVAEAASARTAAVRESVDRTFGGLISSTDDLMYSSNMVETMMSNSKVNAAHIGSLMSSINKADPVLAADIRKNVGEWLSAKLLDNGKPKSGSAYTDMVRLYGDKLRSVYGAEFVENLSKVGRVVGVLEGKSLEHGAADPVQAAWLQLTRTMFGPMSNIQRRITAVNRMTRHLNALRSLSIVSDPDKLRRYVRLEKMDPRSLVFRTEMYELAGRAVTDSVLGEDPQYEEKVAELARLREQAKYNVQLP